MSLITYLTRIHFADRSVEDALPVEVRRLALARPLVLADAAADAADAVDRLLDALPRSAAPIVLRGLPSLPSAKDRARIATARTGGAADGVIGLGGGRVIDLARLAARGRHRAADLPVIAVPTTTAGMGFGPTRFDGPDGTAANAALPVAVICDATLTLAMDRSTTAATGMDALIHCLEAWLGTAFNPPADGIALEGLRRAVGFLERAVADGQDLEARREMLAAALCAGLAAQKGCGGIEALAWAVEVEVGLEERHGLLHAALLPPVLAFNAPAVGDRLGQLPRTLPLPRDADVGACLADLGGRIDLPRRLGSLGIDDAARRRIAAAAAADPANRTNPRHATSTDYLTLLRAAE